MSNNEDVFQVKRLLNRRIRKGQRQYLVRWKDYDKAHDTWEPLDNILDKTLIDQFEQKLKRKLQINRSKKNLHLRKQAALKEKQVDNVQQQSTVGTSSNRGTNSSSRFRRSRMILRRSKRNLLKRNYAESKSDEEITSSPVRTRQAGRKKTNKSSDVGQNSSSNEKKATVRRGGTEKAVVQLSDDDSDEDDDRKEPFVNRVPKFGGSSVQSDEPPPVLSPQGGGSNSDDESDDAIGTRMNRDDDIRITGICVTDILRYHHRWTLTDVNVKDNKVSFIEFL